MKPSDLWYQGVIVIVQKDVLSDLAEPCESLSEMGFVCVKPELKYPNSLIKIRLLGTDFFFVGKFGLFCLFCNPSFIFILDQTVAEAVLY